MLSSIFHCFGREEKVYLEGWKPNHPLSVVFRQKEVRIKCEECAGDCRDEGANCLLTTTPVSYVAQHHVGDGGHPCTTLYANK